MTQVIGDHKTFTEMAECWCFVILLNTGIISVASHLGSFRTLENQHIFLCYLILHTFGKQPEIKFIENLKFK